MKKVFLLVLGLWSSVALAQPGGNNDLLMSLYNQLEALQQEVQTLRGTVDEQANQLRRLETEQRNRYLDIDRRLSDAARGPVTGAPGQMPAAINPATGATDPAPTGAIPGTPMPGTAMPGTTASGTTASGTSVSGTTAPGSTTPGTTLPGNVPSAQNTPPPAIAGNAPFNAAPGNQATAALPPAAQTTAPLNEQDLYRTALNLLLEQSQYEESIRLFQSYIDNYPQGRLLTNAYYWQGEALILVSRFNEAQAVFSKILSDFPQDPKAAGAMLKLGVVYQQMGNNEQARQTWREIATRYPENVTEIRTAQDYLNRR